MEGDNLESAFSTFNNSVYNTAKSVLGHSKRKKTDWSDKSNLDVQDLPADKRETHRS